MPLHTHTHTYIYIYIYFFFFFFFLMLCILPCSDKDLWLALQERLSKPRVSGSICDVYDGQLYQKHAAFVSQPANVTLLLNTDGVSVFRSSKATLWPVWLIVNELPRRLRYEYKTRTLNII